jgi:FKBP-type peptidyl-prolyl cis-trans isomerase
MKNITNSLPALAIAILIAASCDKMTYKKTKSGLAYKIFPSKGKDSLMKLGDIVKFNYTIMYNDSLMDRFNSYGKMPGYVKVQPFEKPTYDFQELLPLMRKGDSAVTVQMTDTLMKLQSPLLPPNPKKGGRLTMTVKIVDVFKADSVAMVDFNKELEKDRPRQEEEQRKEMARMQKEQEEQRIKEEQELEKSGEIAKELREMEQYLAARKITAQKTGKGTYVLIKEQGTGAAAANNKYVNVRYTGRILTTDSVFQSNSYAFQLGKGAVIRGWDEGLLLFKQGGKGTLFIPGFLAYGKNPGPGSKPFEALVFDVELLEVSDSAINNQPREPRQ